MSIRFDNIFQLDETADTCEENKSKHVTNVGWGETVQALRLEIEIFGTTENWWETAELLAKTVHHQEGANESSSDTLDISVSHLSEIDRQQNGDENDEDLDLALEGSDWRKNEGNESATAPSSEKCNCVVFGELV